MSNYTEIPNEYTGKNYDKWFSPEVIKDKFNGDILKAAESHPVYFVYYMLGMKPRDYQVYALDLMVKDRFILGIWGRRMGKSAAFKWFAAWVIVYNKYPQGTNNTTKVVVIAHTQGSADDYITDIREDIKAADLVVERKSKGALGKHYFSQHFPKGASKIADNRNSLAFYNGGWNTIQTFPPTTKARGKAASIIITDEIGFWCDYTSLQKDDYTIYNEVVRPIITDSPKSKILAATTPNGASGLSYDLMDIDSHRTRFKLLWFPYYYRKDDAYIQDILDTEKEYSDAGRHDSFRQEYLAELVSKTNSYFHKENEIDKVFNQNYSMEYTYTGECFVGIDFGGSTKSRTVYTVSAFINGQLTRIHHKRYPLREDATLQEDLVNLNKRFPNIRKFNVDSQGGGSGFYAWFRNTFGSHMINEVSFKGEKVDMYRLFRVKCYQDVVKSYYDLELLDEFTGFTGDLKPSKHTTDDLLDSFVLSVKEWLVEGEKKPKVGVIIY